MAILEQPELNFHLEIQNSNGTTTQRDSQRMLSQPFFCDLEHFGLVLVVLDLDFVIHWANPYIISIGPI